jgi:cytochrome P450
LQNPATLAKLQQELETGDLSRPIPTFAQVSKLPYLHATIREGMRLFPPLAHPLERLVPVGGVEICGKFLPQGTSVRCLQLALHLNPKAFGEDAETFRPERWLEASPEVLRVMEASHLGFGRGRRVCLGQNLAVMEMKKVIPAMLMGFDVSSFVWIPFLWGLYTDENLQISLDDPDARLEADLSVAILSPKELRVKMKAKG